MSYKVRLVKMAIKMTPDKMIIWVANKILKDIAQLTAFHFDIDNRKTYVQTLLQGENEAIDVWLEDFSVTKDGDSYHFILQHAQSNKPWLQNLLAKFVGKAWKIPVPPKFTAQIDLLAELLQAEKSALESIQQES